MAIDPWPCGLSAATRRYIGSIPSSVRATISSVANGDKAPRERSNGRQVRQGREVIDTPVRHITFRQA
jgi:hypothetical protein